MMLFLGWLIQEQSGHRRSSRRRQPMDAIDLTLILVIKACLIVLYLTVPPLIVDATNNNEAHPQQQQKLDEAFFFLCSGGQLEELQAALEENPGETGAGNDSERMGMKILRHTLAGVRGDLDVVG